jgi:DNA-binding response OmpR family regulator
MEMLVPDLTLSGQCILIVEDEYLMSDDLRQELERHGATVLGPAGAVDRALYLAASASRIDGAVLDINLNGEMVFPVLDALLQRDVPVLAGDRLQRG